MEKYLRKKKTTWIHLALFVCLVGIFCLYVAVAIALLQTTSLKEGEERNHVPVHDPSVHDQASSHDIHRGKSGYFKFKDIAVELAGLNPSETIERLRSADPFETRAFEQRLLGEETRLGRILSKEELESLFPCPDPEDRISFPDARNASKAASYRNSELGYFIFFQHLRKAGGTQFCSLASKNIPRTKLPPYYCMPDYHWKDTIGSAGSLHHYTNKVIAQHMLGDGYAIAGNEWDTFDRLNHFDLPAVIVTSFRKPLDRALSQYRFECVEDRGCTAKTIEQYWERRKQLHNVYTRTFADPANQYGEINRKILGSSFLGTNKEDSLKRKQLIGDALDTIRKFHVVTSLEFIAYSEPMIQSVLGFKNTTSLTTRVRPHINQHQRKDGQNENKIGAAGVKKASWDPETYLVPEQYKLMSETLALDEILTDAARRLFLERLICEDY
mmetsp:Transcript_10408/g.13772  ORF Transcript_10408/g.13772 Transcript_10408/m.13772 type:complete len:442 (+) Transcript_10408:139-1464(+)